MISIVRHREHSMRRRQARRIKLLLTRLRHSVKKIKEKSEACQKKHFLVGWWKWCWSSRWKWCWYSSWWWRWWWRWWYWLRNDVDTDEEDIIFCYWRLLCRCWISWRRYDIGDDDDDDDDDDEASNNDDDVDIDVNNHDDDWNDDMMITKMKMITKFMMMTILIISMSFLRLVASARRHIFEVVVKMSCQIDSRSNDEKSKKYSNSSLKYKDDVD